MTYRLLFTKESMEKSVKILLLFCSYIAEKDCTSSQDAVRVLIQHLCTKCPDKADYRVLVAKVLTVKFK